MSEGTNKLESIPDKLELQLIKDRCELIESEAQQLLVLWQWEADEGHYFSGWAWCSLDADLKHLTSAEHTRPIKIEEALLIYKAPDSDEHWESLNLGYEESNS